MEIQSEQEAFAQLKTLYEHIYVIISPPRCSSTAFARVFWEQPSIRYYSHEPFEVTYFDGANLQEVITKLEQPLDLLSIKSYPAVDQPASLVIKEMPYQVGKNFELLVSLTRKPIMFLIRDPRLNVASRITKKKEVGQNPNFPLIETGWELLSEQVRYCQAASIPYFIVDSLDFRSCPSEVFAQIFNHLKLPFSPEMLSWRATPNVNLDNLGGQHSHLYERVLLSTGIEPATEEIPNIEDMPAENSSNPLLVLIWTRRCWILLRISAASYQVLMLAPKTLSRINMSVQRYRKPD